MCYNTAWIGHSVGVPGLKGNAVMRPWDNATHPATSPARLIKYIGEVYVTDKVVKGYTMSYTSVYKVRFIFLPCVLATSNNIFYNYKCIMVFKILLMSCFISYVLSL